MKRGFYQHPSAIIDSGALLGEGSKVWHFCHVCGGAMIGDNSVLGQNCFIADDVKIGSNVKIQNNVSVYSGVEIDDDVFLGPSCVFTNVSNPRSQVVRKSLYERTFVEKGASIGANATIVCGITVGMYSFVAAGTVVTKDVKPYALMMGVPARQAGWIGRHGHRLDFCSNSIARCPESGLRYRLVGVSDGLEGTIGSSVSCECLDLEEREELPEDLAVGTIGYRDVKRKNGK